MAYVYDNRGPQVVAVTGLFLALSYLAVSLRCYVRVCMTKSFGPEDWLAVASLISFTVFSTIVLFGVRYGIGRHLGDIPPDDVIIALKWWWWGELAYVPTTALIKATIAAVLVRICAKRYQLCIIYSVMTIVILFSILYFFLILFQCQPIYYFWTKYSGGEGRCLTIPVVLGLTYAHATISALADWTIGILPIFLVWNLELNSRTKISVALILALGAIGSTATIVRIPYIGQLAASFDFLYLSTDITIWSVVEPGIGTTAASIACLRPLFKTFLSHSRLMRGGGASRPRAGRLMSGPTYDLEELSVRADVGNWLPPIPVESPYESIFSLEFGMAQTGVGITRTNADVEDFWRYKARGR